MNYDSVNNLSTSHSVTSETKEKFDALLKAALGKSKLSTAKHSQSNEKLVIDLETNNGNNSEARNILETNDERNNKSFILNKFLHDSNNVDGNSVTEKIKPPVPIPRKRKEKEVDKNKSNHNTFNISSPKILNDESTSSKGTYNVNSHNNHEIGDVLIHTSPTAAKVLVISNRSLTKPKADDMHNNSCTSSSASKSESKLLKDGDTEVTEEDLNHEIVSVKSNDLSLDCKTKKKNISVTNEINSKYKYENIIEIIIHKTDRLLLNSFVTHPVVQVHIININTGKYYHKSDNKRAVVFYYENENHDYILPVMTKAFNLQEKRSIYPMWEETILLNEDFNHLLNENIIIFFEILDYPSFTSTINIQKIEKNCHKGWHRIAFAFLKTMGKNNISNLNKTVRLQLYYPSQSKKQEMQKCYLWHWWKLNKFKKYPSTLYVTISSVISPRRVVDAFRSKTPLQREIRSMKTLKSNNQDNVKLLQTQPNDKIEVSEKYIASISSFGSGCFIFKFSNNGHYLAAAMQIEDVYYTVIYDVESFDEIQRTSCHKNIIYSIVWSKDDTLLLSASADNTVAIWDFNAHNFLQILPHPQFVYSCDISNSNIIVTGCYDSTVRIWETDSSEIYNLKQELKQHRGFITSLCFSKKTTLIYSADSTGMIVVWQKDENDDSWTFFREITLINLKNVAINQIILFKNEKKMLIHARDSTIRIISLKNLCVMYWLQGALNRRYQTCCSLSPCEKFVLAGSENGLVIKWNTKTGANIKTFELYSNSTAVFCTQFHPHKNIFAASHYGSNQPILVYECDTEISHLNNKCFTEHTNKVHNDSLHCEQTGKANFKDILLKIDELLQ